MSGKWLWGARLLRVLGHGAGDRLKDQPLFSTRFTVLDAEMTGLDLERDELLAIGAIRMVGPRILLSERFYHLIRPQSDRWGTSVPIHGIRPADVADAPALCEVLPAFAAFARATIFVGHGVEIDRKFLERASRRCGVPLVHTLWIDTGRVARWLASHHGVFLEAAADRGRFALEELLVVYDIEPPARHHALADAFATAQVWQRQLYALAAEGVTSIQDLRLSGLC